MSLLESPPRLIHRYAAGDVAYIGPGAARQHRGKPVVVEHVLREHGEQQRLAVTILGGELRALWNGDLVKPGDEVGS